VNFKYKLWPSWSNHSVDACPQVDGKHFKILTAKFNDPRV